MRGSIYYQTAQLAKTIFRPSSKKSERVDPTHEYYQCVAAYSTMDSYREIWNNFAKFLRDSYGIKDLEQSNEKYIQSYLQHKFLDSNSLKYADKLVSALGKLEVALNHFSQQVSHKKISYDFSIRLELLKMAKQEDLVYDGYHDRAYKDPLTVIKNMKSEKHRLAATIQLESGTRFEGIGMIKKSQLKGTEIHSILNEPMGCILTKEKGGKEGIIEISIKTYEELQIHLDLHKTFNVNYQEYARDIRQSCQKLNINNESSHGFRWCFAQKYKRVFQEHGLTLDQARQEISWRMKHYRMSITDHYMG